MLLRLEMYPSFCFSGYLTGTICDIAMAALDYVLNSFHTAHPSKHSLKLVRPDCLCSQGLSRVIQKDGSSHLNANGHLSGLIPYATAFSSEQKLFAPLLRMAKEFFTGRDRALLKLITDDWAKLTPQSAISECLDL